MQAAHASDKADRELVFTRTFDAPRELVFEAWTRPEHIVHWWGPNGFRTTVQQMDVRPGGEWRLVMHGPDGRDYRNRIVFVEVVRPDRLLYRHVPEEGTEPVGFDVSVSFAEEAGKTRVTMRQTFPTAAVRDHVVRTYRADEGGRQTLDRLDEWVTAPGRTRFVVPPGEPIIIVSRWFEAPRPLVFEAWTRPEHLSHWWGPRGFTIVRCEADLRAGGWWRIVQRAPDGREHPFKGEYRELVAPERIVGTFAYDVEGVRDRPAVVTTTFHERDGRRTRVTQVMTHASVADRDGHVRSGMAEGATETMERLDAYLTTTSLDEVVITRLFDAPRSLVFEAWTSPEHLARWWGPKGFTLPSCVMDFRPGGAYRYCMRGPDGQEHWAHGHYREVVAPERIVMTTFIEASPGHEIITTVSFSEEGGMTRVTVRQTRPASDVHARGQRQGWTESLEKLAVSLAMPGRAA